MRIWIVLCPGPFVMGAYENADSAHLHAKTLSGASVVECELLKQVPAEVRDDIYISDVDDFDDETPVDEVPIPAGKTSTKG